MATRAWFSVRRRRRSPRYDAGAFALVVVILAVAVAGVYLLALGAAVFVGWLLRVATRRISEGIAETPPPVPSVLAAAPYRAVYAVDPVVFGDEAAAKASARRAFEAWVGTQPSGPRRSIDLVRSVDVRTRYVGRVTTELEGRRVVECCEPAASREPLRSPVHARQAIDAWNPPPDLARTSRYVAMCWSCHGSGRVECARCGGSARRPCTSCDGSGKYYGQTANGAHRMLNCKTCRGKGHITCADCTKGKIECAMCRQAKRLACWLEIRSDLRQELQLVPDDPGMRAFAWGQPGVCATPDQLAGDARIVDVVAKLRPLTPADLPASVPAEWRLEHGPSMQARVEPGERVRSQTFTFLAVPSASVAYSVLGEEHVVVLEGSRMLAPPVGEPFVRRARVLGRIKLALAALPVAAAVLYAARGEYFTSGRAAGLVAGVVVAAVAAAVLAYGVLWNATLGRRARTWAAATIAPAALAVVMAAIAEPRMARAHDLIAAGELDDAAAEMRALDRPPGDAAWADLHLRRSLAAATCLDATARLHDIDTGLPQRAPAQTHADDLALSEAQAAIRVRDAEVASTALGCGSAALRTTVAARAILAQIAGLQTRRCIEIKDWACALDRSASAGDPAALRSDILAVIRVDADAHAAAAARDQRLEQRVEEEQAALGLWQTYLLAQEAATPPRPVVELRAALARDQSALATQQRIAQARAEAEARRAAAAAERERKQAELAAERERRRQAAEEERANRSSGRLLCNDGTLSPTCTCGGAHRGCCSWHGGVAGCQ
jgi:hypothetical protein